MCSLYVLLYVCSAFIRMFSLSVISFLNILFCDLKKHISHVFQLFELLGFDRFELIEQILVNRDKIIKAKVAESTRAIMQQVPSE